MRGRTRHVPGIIRAVGTLILIVLPLVVATALKGFAGTQASVLADVVVFLIVGASAQLGLIVRRWGNINLGRLVFDLALLAVAGGLSWVVVDIAVKRGGGPVDPFLIAVIMAYLLAMWSGQHP